MSEEGPARESQPAGGVVSISLSDSLFRAGPVLMLRGYKRAIDRYLAAAQQDTDFGGTFIPLFEALGRPNAPRLRREGIS